MSIRAQAFFTLISGILISASSSFAATHVRPENLCQKLAVLHAVAQLEHAYPGFEVDADTSVLKIDQASDHVTVTFQDGRIQDAPIDVRLGIDSSVNMGKYNCAFSGESWISTPDHS